MQTQEILVTELPQVDTDTLRQAMNEPGNPVTSATFLEFISPEEAQAMCEQIYALEPIWRKGTCHGEFTVGRVWYTSIDNDEMDQYFEEAPWSRELIQSNFPGLEEKIVQFGRAFSGNDDVVIRPGWAGPGFVVFTAGCGSSQLGGAVHIDYEGIPIHLVDQPGTEAYSFICPIKLPPGGGGNLRIWPIDRYIPERKDRYYSNIEDPAGPMCLVEYKQGGLSGICSYMVHQIEPFGGDSDRICLTFHLAQFDGQWQIWF